MNTETTPAPKDDERAKFEAWTKTQRRHIDIDTWDDVPGGLYCDDETSKLLEGWLARAASGAPQEAPGDAPDVVISEYRLRSGKWGGTGDIRIGRAGQMEGPDKWAVRRAGLCLNKSGEWDWEPMPSSREDDFLARCRFDTEQEAISAARAAMKGPQ